MSYNRRMATIRKLPSGRWNAMVRRKGVPTRSRTFATKAAAQTWARREEQLIEEGRAAFDSGATLSDVLRWYAGQICSRKGFREDLMRIRAWERSFGARKVGELTPSELSDFAQGRLSRCAGSTIQREFAVLSSALERAGTMGLIAPDVNPAKVARKFLHTTGQLRISPSRIRRLEPGEEQRLYDQCPPFKGFEDIIRFALETAMRRAEIARARLSHLNHQGLLIEDDKSGQTTRIPISTRAVALLQAYPDGFGRGPDNITKTFSRIRRRAGLIDLRFHDLRREAISRYFEMGLGVAEVRAISRHRTLGALSIYTRPSVDSITRKLG